MNFSEWLQDRDPELYEALHQENTLLKSLKRKAKGVAASLALGTAMFGGAVGDPSPAGKSPFDPSLKHQTAARQIAGYVGKRRKEEIENQMTKNRHQSIPKINAPT